MIWDRILRSVGEYWGASRSSKWPAVRRSWVKSNPHALADAALMLSRFSAKSAI
jgi:hypothetical protein